MIPRFVIRNASTIVGKLISLGYTVEDNPLSTDALILGKKILNSTTVPSVKNPLIKVLDAPTQSDEVMELAKMQMEWLMSAKRTELTLGDPKKGKVIVTPQGVMIDSCIIPITPFRQLLNDLGGFKSPFIASHSPVINTKRPFLTVGCADYTIEDLSTIISAHEKLLEPAP